MESPPDPILKSPQRPEGDVLGRGDDFPRDDRRDDSSAQGAVAPAPARWTPLTPEHLSKLLPQYEIERMLGRGSFGAVYKGRQPGLDRAVSIKLLPVEAATDEAFVARFLREARTLAGVHHAGIASVYDCGQTSEGHLFVVSEFVEGTDLERVIYGRGLSVKQAADMIVQVCDALHYAHSQGIVHRHIKPANVIVTQGGRAKLVDFDIASPLLDDASHLTHENVMLDAPDYIAPEHLSGQADHRADLYSVGVLMYEMLTRLIPKGRFDPPSRLVPDLDPRYDAMVEKAMEAEPAARYSSALEIRGDIEEILRTPDLSAGVAGHDAPVPPLERPATVSIPLSAILEMQAVGPARAIPAEASTTSLARLAPELRPDSVKPPPPGPTVAVAPQEKDWSAVHGRRGFWSWKLGAAAGVLALGLIGGGVYFWYLSMVEPDVWISTRKVDLAVGDEAREVKIEVTRGELKLEQANESLPDGLKIEPAGRTEDTTTYRLTGKATEESRTERVRLIAVRGNNSSSKTLEIVIKGTSLEWQPDKDVKLTAGQPIPDGRRLVSGVVTSRADWNPACPGVEVTRSDDDGGSLELAGLPAEAGIFELSVTATARFGDPDTRVFQLVVEKEMTVAVVGNSPAPIPVPAAAPVHEIPKDLVVARVSKPEIPASAVVKSPVPSSPVTPPVASSRLAAVAPPHTMAPGMIPAPPKADPPPPATPATQPTVAPSQSVPVAPGVAALIPGTYTQVKSPYGVDRKLAVGPKEWNAGEVRDATAGRSALMPKIDDPRLRALPVDSFSHTARNPYSSEVENWGQDWKAGASRAWARGLTYHLPDPLPEFKAPPIAKYKQGTRSIINPYDGTPMPLSWAKLAEGGTIKDSSARPIRLPLISDPRLPATVVDGEKRTYINPYTNEKETWSPRFRDKFGPGAKGDWKSLSFILGQVPAPVRPAIPSPAIPSPSPAPVASAPVRTAPPAPPKPPNPRAELKGNAFSTSRSFNMKFVKGEGYWISVTAVSTGSISDVKKLCDDLTKECKGIKMPANYYFTTGPGPLGTHLMAVPK